MVEGGTSKEKCCSCTLKKKKTRNKPVTKCSSFYKSGEGICQCSSHTWSPPPEVLLCKLTVPLLVYISDNFIWRRKHWLHPSPWCVLWEEWSLSVTTGACVTRGKACDPASAAFLRQSASLWARGRDGYKEAHMIALVAELFVCPIWMPRVVGNGRH